MDKPMKLLLLGMFYSSLFSYYKIIGVDGGRKMSKEDEIENELKLLNKPYVKTVTTKYGDIYDCVDFYKQPAFDHPLLKNHSFHHQMKPSSMPKMRGGKKLSNEYTEISKVRVGCPVGTVPIRRTTREDIIRAKLHSEKYGSNNVMKLGHPGYHYAIATTKFDSNKRYIGGGTEISVWNPAPVISSQYSSSRLKLQNGRNSIEVGWTVNPTLFGDNKTRGYIHSMNAGQPNSFNNQCSGFVLVDKDAPIGGVLEPVTQRGRGIVWSWRLLIKRDPTDGNWWLHSGRQLAAVGFWPKCLFTDLSDFATTIEWGGEVFSPPTLLSPPTPMGSGEPTIRDDTAYDAFCKFMTTIEEGALSREDVRDLQLYNDDSNYNIKDVGYDIEDFGHTVLFGGS